MEYGDLEPDVRAGWVTGYNSGSKTYTVCTVTPFPVSGRTMKQRLVEHEAWLNEAYRTHEQWRENLARVLSDVKSLIQSIPDAQAQEISCVAYGRENGQNVHVVLSKGDRVTGMPLAAGSTKGLPGGLKDSALPGQAAQLNFSGRHAGTTAPGSATRFGSSRA
jgi:hypothetical protein